MSPENEKRLEILRSAPLNKWVALSEDEASIVAIGDTFDEVSRQSDLAGVSNAVILKTPEQWSALSV